MSVYLLRTTSPDSLRESKRVGLAHGHVHEITTYTFSIETARELQLLIGAVSEPTVLLITFTRATTEAQNALLKTLEELPEVVDWHFILHPSVGLLPTVLSRLTEEQDPSSTEKLSIAWESESLANLLKQFQASEPAVLHNLLDAIESREEAPCKIAALKARRWLSLPGASSKTITEYVLTTCYSAINHRI